MFLVVFVEGWYGWDVDEPILGLGLLLLQLFVELDELLIAEDVVVVRHHFGEDDEVCITAAEAM